MPSLVRQSPAPDKGGVAPFLPTRAQEEATGQKQLLTQWEKSLGAEVIPHVPGTPLPNVEKARFLPEKLTRYALDFTNPRGRDKARVFQSVLGITSREALDVERQVMAALPTIEPTPSKIDKYGQTSHADVPVTGPNGKTALVRTSWIYDRHEDGAVSIHPRLTTIFVK